MTNEGFHFQLSQPSGRLSAMVQGFWVAAVDQSEAVTKPLYSDAGSGIVLNLFGGVEVGGQPMPSGIIMLPTSMQAEQVCMKPGCLFVGIRFHPAIGYGVLGRHYIEPTLLAADEDIFQLHDLYQSLINEPDIQKYIPMLYEWAEQNLDFTHVIPKPLEKSLQYIRQADSLSALRDEVNVSQRQIERMCKLWLGMTPKHYQRILRIRKAIEFLRENASANLADVAHEFGFSDQAHMTREFRTIACMTPKQVLKRKVCDHPVQSDRAF